MWTKLGHYFCQIWRSTPRMLSLAVIKQYFVFTAAILNSDKTARQILSDVVPLKSSPPKCHPRSLRNRIRSALPPSPRVKAQDSRRPRIQCRCAARLEQSELGQCIAAVSVSIQKGASWKRNFSVGHSATDINKTQHRLCDSDCDLEVHWIYVAFLTLLFD